MLLLSWQTNQTSCYQSWHFPRLFVLISPANRTVFGPGLFVFAPLCLKPSPWAFSSALEFCFQSSWNTSEKQEKRRVSISIITWQGLLFHMALVWVLIGTFPSSSGQLRCRHPVSIKFQTCGGSLNAFCHQTLHIENSSGYFRAHSSSRWNIMQIRSDRKCEKYEDFLPWRSQFSGLRL